MKQIRKYRTSTFVILGLLACIPILGGVIGLVILILGLFVYQNKQLVILGIAGIIITSSIILYLNYNTTHRGIYDESRIAVAKTKLKSLLKEIEFYKLNNGYYPKNLLELKNETSWVNFNDPIQQVHPDSSDHNFYYESINKKYQLFSKGFDGKAFTSDDVLPQIDIHDSSKIGLIIR